MLESGRADSDLLSNADFRTSPQESGYRLKAVNSEKAIEPMVAERQYLAEPRWSRISAAFSKAPVRALRIFHKDAKVVR
jgi:hypothetical protein